MKSLAGDCWLETCPSTPCSTCHCHIKLSRTLPGLLAPGRFIISLSIQLSQPPLGTGSLPPLCEATLAPRVSCCLSFGSAELSRPACSLEANRSGPPRAGRTASLDESGGFR